MASDITDLPDNPPIGVLDAPFVQDLGAAGQWRPQNYNMTFNGPTTMRSALEKSLNMVTIRLAERVGMDAVARTAVAFHVVDGMPRVLPAALGAVESTVLRQAAAYAGLAQNGKEVLPTLVDTVQDREGKVIWRAPGLECRVCADPARAPGIADTRRQVQQRAAGFKGRVLVVDSAGLPKDARPAITWRGNLGHLSVGAHAVEVRVAGKGENVFSLGEALR